MNATRCALPAATLPHVLERGVRVGGSDAWCRGALFVHAEDKYAATPDAGLIGAGETQSP